MKIKAAQKPASKTSGKSESAKVPPDNPKRHPGSMPTSLAANPIGMSEERKALYTEYNASTPNGEETPPPESEKGPEETPGVETPATSPEEEATETPPEVGEPKEEESSPEAAPVGPAKEEEETPSEEAKPEEKHTVVPHAALHEERMSHKETKAKLQEALQLAKEAQQQLKVMIEEIARVKEAPSPKPESEPDKPIEDFEGYVKELAKKVDSLVLDNRRLREQRLEELEDQRANKMQKAVALIASELEAQGFPGFDKFRQLVADRIEQKAKGDQKLLLRWDNPEGWAEIYQKEVYPEVANVFKVAIKETKKNDKEILKDKANLVGTNGKPVVKPPKEEPKPWGLGDYYEARQKRRIT